MLEGRAVPVLLGMYEISFDTGLTAVDEEQRRPSVRLSASRDECTIGAQDQALDPPFVLQVTGQDFVLIVLASKNKNFLTTPDCTPPLFSCIRYLRD